MNVSWKRLSEYADLSGLAPEEVAERLVHAGIEIAETRRLGAELADVIVARIESRDRHPNADKLSLCAVSDGARTYKIVCGADNMKAGDRVALARAGVTLPKTSKFPDGITMKRAKIRGEESEGMMCSEQELGLADASAGIMILPPDAPLGAPLPEALGIADAVLAAELTPNRGDCLSIRGIAREVAALYGRELKARRIVPEEKGPEIGTLASVEVREPALCPRYAARVLRGVRVGESPAWMKAALEAAGMRPINNVVDATNFVMWELGQPLHAFDLSRLAGRRIVVRRAREGEPMPLLDGSARSLAASDLVIADAERPVALAGVMGGANSEISEATADVLLESAYFDPGQVRRTARRLGLHTDSSHRFERGVDPAAVAEALDAAAALVAELAGGEVARGGIDVYPAPIAAPPIHLAAARARKLLGAEFSDAEIERTLGALGVRLAKEGPGVWTATPPSWRSDLAREADLIEEVVRVLGYGRVPEAPPAAALTGESPWSAVDLAERRARARLLSLGFHEAVNYSFQDGALWDRLGAPADSRCRRMVEIVNPLASHMRYLRTSLLPGLAQSLAANQRAGARGARLFEAGRCYFEGAAPGELDAEAAIRAEEAEIEAGVLARGRAEDRHEETPRVAFAFYGPARDPRWNEKGRPADFYDAKGVAEALLRALGAGEARFAREAGDGAMLFHPAQRAAVLRASDGLLLGRVGRLHPDLAAYADVAGEVWGAEFDLAPLAREREEAIRHEELPRFPAVQRDVTAILDAGTSAEAVLSALAAQRQGLLKNVEILDLYQGNPIPPGKKALTLRLTYQDQGKTLTDEKINATHSKLVERLLQSVGGSLSSS